MVLTYSNVEAIRVCFSESFEALAEGLEECIWQMGRVPVYHRTDNLSAAVRDLDRNGMHEFTDNYLAVLNHYGMKPAANTAGCANQNGDVEQSHYRFKTAVDQTLRVRGGRDEMEVLFTLLAERYERKSTVITTNLVFSAWERIFKDPMTTLAAIDRVVHHSVVLDLMAVESYRARAAKATKKAPLQAAAG
jgi:hypothetical protein